MPPVHPHSPPPPASSVSASSATALDPETVSHITDLVRSLVVSNTTSVDTSAHHLTSHPSYVFSEAWYRSLRPKPLTNPHPTPINPAFFRIHDPPHLVDFAAADDHARDEADTLLQVLALLRDNLNRQYRAMDATSNDALVDNWKHTRGIFEMLQTRYDILSGVQNNRVEQVRMLRALTTPPLGPSHLARLVNHAIKEATDPPTISRSPSLSSPSYDFLFLVRAFDALESVHESVWLDLCDHQWRLAVYPTTPRQPLLYAYLECRPLLADASWSLHTRFSIKLLNAETDLYKLATTLTPTILHPLPPVRAAVEGCLEEHLEHSFTHDANDWGCAICPQHLLREGQFTDRHMNLVFLLSLQIDH